MTNNQFITKYESGKKICKAASHKSRSPNGSEVELPFYPPKCKAAMQKRRNPNSSGVELPFYPPKNTQISKPASPLQEITTNESLDQRVNLKSDSAPNVSSPGEDCPSNIRKEQSVSSTDVGLDTFPYAQSRAKEIAQGPNIESLGGREKVNPESDSTPKVGLPSNIKKQPLISSNDIGVSTLSKKQPSISSNDLGVSTFSHVQPRAKETTQGSNIESLDGRESYSTPKASSLGKDSPSNLRKQQPISSTDAELQNKYSPWRPPLREIGMEAKPMFMAQPISNIGFIGMEGVTEGSFSPWNPSYLSHGTTGGARAQVLNGIMEGSLPQGNLSYLSHGSTGGAQTQFLNGMTQGSFPQWNPSYLSHGSTGVAQNQLPSGMTQGSLPQWNPSYLSHGSTGVAQNQLPSGMMQGSLPQWNLSFLSQGSTGGAQTQFLNGMMQGSFPQWNPSYLSHGSTGGVQFLR